MQNLFFILKLLKCRFQGSKDTSLAYLLITHNSNKEFNKSNSSELYKWFNTSNSAEEQQKPHDEGPW